MNIRVSVGDNKRLSISISGLEFFHELREKLELDINDPVYSVTYAKD